MRKVIGKIWGFCCVPAVLLCQGIIFSVIFRAVTSGDGYMGSFGRFALALSLVLVGMFLLRKTPKSALIRSSAVACAISLLIALLGLTAANGSGLPNIYDALRFFIITPNNIVLPVTSAVAGAPSPALAILFTVVEILFPMVYVFSGVFARLTVMTGRSANDSI